MNNRRRDDRRDSKRDRRVVEDPRDPREYRESRESNDWSEWTWSAERNSYYRYKLGPNGEAVYEFDAQPGVSSQTSTYPGPSNAQGQPWNQGLAESRAEWDRQSHQPAPPPHRVNDSYLPPSQPPAQLYTSNNRQMLPPALPTAAESSHRPPSGGGGRGRESRDPRDPRDLRDPRDPRDLRDPRDPRGQQARPAEKKEYFIPGEGIDREVITADLCRYLDRDALVRPGTSRNPRTGQNQTGFWITALSHLTPENIADLKADTQRWHEERQSRGDVYRHSQVHDTRQYYGPSNIYGMEVPASSSRYSGPIEVDTRSTNYASSTPIEQVTHTQYAQLSQPQHPQHPQNPQQTQSLSATGGYPPTAMGSQYGQPQNYITSGRGGYYPADGQPQASQERQTIQTQGYTQPRSATYFDSQTQPSMTDSPNPTSTYDQTTDETQSPYASAIRTQSSTTTTTAAAAAGFGHAAAAPTSTARVGRTETVKRQRSHDPDEMEYSE